MASADPSDLGADPTPALIEAGSRILTLLDQGGVKLGEPLNFLALQLLGPVLAKAVGDDIRRNQDNILTIVEAMDVSEIQRLLGKGRP